MDRLTNARVKLRAMLEQASTDVADWGPTPDPQEWMDAFEEFIDSKLIACRLIADRSDDI